MMWWVGWNVGAVGVWCGAYALGARRSRPGEPLNYVCMSPGNMRVLAHTISIISNIGVSVNVNGVKEDDEVGGMGRQA